MEVSLRDRFRAIDVCDVPVGATVVSVRATVPSGTAIVVGQTDARGAVPVFSAVRCSDGRTHEVQPVGGAVARYVTATLVAGPPCVATIDVVFAPWYDRAAPARLTRYRDLPIPRFRTSRGIGRLRGATRERVRCTMVAQCGEAQ